MNIKSMITFSLAAISTSLTAMPTKQELDTAAPVIQELLKADLEALNSGAKTRKEVAKAAIDLMVKSESEAQKLLLLKGAYNHYLRDGAQAEAAGTLKLLVSVIPDIPPQYVANIIESSLRGVSKKNNAEAYEWLDEAKCHVKCQNALTADSAKAAKNPNDKALHLRMAENYAIRGDWAKALEEFAKGSNRKAAEMAASELGTGSKIAKRQMGDFWWKYGEDKKDEYARKTFKLHAAKCYSSVLIAGKLSGLEKSLVEQRVKEGYAFGDEGIMPKTHVERNSVASILKGMIKIPAMENATHPVRKGDYWLSETELTQGQWQAVMGVLNSGNMEAEGDQYVKGAQYPATCISRNDCDVFLEKLNSTKEVKESPFEFTLPTNDEWQYIARCGVFEIDYSKPEMADYLATITWSKENTLIGNGNAVATKAANAFGFYDMFGNETEWVLGRDKPKESS